MSDESDELAVKIRTDIPHSARIWNYWMGGRDNFDIDRIIGDQSLDIDPHMSVMARECRQFLIRTVHYVASQCGIRQFLDIGTGLPTMQNTHEVAQGAAPESKIVYVDNDPMVLAHARALLTSTTDEGVTGYVDSDFHDPERIVADARNILNFRQPVAVMFMGVLGHAESLEVARQTVSAVTDAVPSGSYFIYYDGTTDRASYVELCEEYAKTGGVPYIPRPHDEMRSIFDGFELVDPPGFVPVTQWRIDDSHADVDESRLISASGGVARKP
ncbi:MAG: SAM-dependent methyltransferase [Stackebrandtia sp.]